MEESGIDRTLNQIKFNKQLNQSEMEREHNLEFIIRDMYEQEKSLFQNGNLALGPNTRSPIGPRERQIPSQGSCMRARLTALHCRRFMGVSEFRCRRWGWMIVERENRGCESRIKMENKPRIRKNIKEMWGRSKSRKKEDSTEELGTTRSSELMR